MQDRNNRQKSPSENHRTTLSGYIFATKARIDNRKNLLSSNISSKCPHNMVNFGPLTAEIYPVVWGTQLISTGFASWQRYCTALKYCASGKLGDVEQRASPIFGRAAITLGIGPHSSLLLSRTHIRLPRHTTEWSPFFSSTILEFENIYTRITQFSDLTRNFQLDFADLFEVVNFGAVTHGRYLDDLVARQQPLLYRPGEPFPDLDYQRVLTAVFSLLQRRSALEHDGSVLVQPRARYVEVLDSSRCIDTTCRHSKIQSVLYLWPPYMEYCCVPLKS